MINTNFDAIYQAIRDKYPPQPGEFNTKYNLPDFQNFAMTLTVTSSSLETTFVHLEGHDHNDYFDIDYSVKPTGMWPTGAMAESTRHLPAVLDWLSELVDAPFPVWERTEDEILQEEIARLDKLELHNRLLSFMGQRAVSLSRRPFDINGAVTYHRFRKGKVEFDREANPSVNDIDAMRLLLLSCERNRRRRKTSAKKAAETRKRRRELKVDREVRRIANALAAGLQRTALETGVGDGTTRKCKICGKKLSDEASMRRGIGSECWQEVIGRVELFMKQQEVSDND